MTSVPRALLYVRISANNDRFNVRGSLTAQLARCRAYVAANAWTIGGEYSDVMSDRDNRPSYRALLEEARRLHGEGGPVVVVTASLDRLGRRMLEALRCRRELRELGVPLHSVAEGGEVPDVVANILAAVAQEEAQQVSRRIKAVLQHQVAQGWHLVGAIRWGYRLRPATPEERAESSPPSVLVVDPVTAPYVREMFDRAAAGENLRSLERWTASLSSEARGGRVLRHADVARALRSPVYVARMLCGDSDILRRPIGRWPPLVDDTLWQRVQDRLASPLHPEASGKYLLTGFLRCMRCGGRAGKASNRGRPSYICLSTRGCRLRNRVGSMPILDALVMREIEPLVERLNPTTDRARRALCQAWDADAPPRAADERRRRRLERTVERAEKRLSMSGFLLDSGELDQGGYELVRDGVLAELADVQSSLDAIRTVTRRVTFPSSSALLILAAGWHSALQGDDVPAQRDVLAALITRVDPVRLARNTFSVDITWSDVGLAAQRATRRAAGRKGVAS